MRIRQIFIDIVAILMASLMLYTAKHKFADYDLNREQLELMPLIHSFAGLLVWALPVAEILIALILIIPRTRILGLYLVTGLMAVFSIYVVVLMNAPKAVCTCGGFLQSLTWLQHLFFNIGCVAAGIIAIVLAPRQTTNQKTPFNIANA